MESMEDDSDDRHDHDVVDADTDLLRVVQRFDSHLARLPRKEDAENEEHRYPNMTTYTETVNHTLTRPMLGLFK